jgi:Ion transport protein
MASESKELKNTTYEAFIGILSVLSILNIAFIYLARSDEVDSVVYIMSGFLSAIFLVDFTFRFVTAHEDRWRYFFREFGWADLVASVPIPQFKILRVFRLFRAYRLGKAYGVRNMARTFWEERAQSALLAVLLFILLLLSSGAWQWFGRKRTLPAPTSRRAGTPSGGPTSRSPPLGNRIYTLRGRSVDASTAPNLSLARVLVTWQE